ncbi:hypothetical protein O23A_p0075 [Aeromonas salmonicida]|nr:hypothetical protein O23A_p0075 [Aeromonas salmonicida]
MRVWFHAESPGFPGDFLCANRHFLHEKMAGKRFSEIIDKRL